MIARKLTFTLFMVAALLAGAFVAWRLLPARSPADAAAASSPRQAPPHAAGPALPPQVRAAPEPAPETGAAAERVRSAVARLKDSRVPLEDRRAELEVLARRGDREAVAILKALGDEQAYLGWLAVEKLGEVAGEDSRAERAAYLERKLSAPDARVLCAAVRALGRLQGGAAVDALARTIRDNRVRPDGHQDMVCTAAVEALRGIASPQSVAVLGEELARSGEKGWSLEYGSVVVAALGNIGSPEARAAAAAYADRLAAQIPADAMAREYYLKKIAEARQAAGAAVRT